LDKNFVEITLSIISILVLLSLRGVFRRAIVKHSEKYDLDLGQRKYAYKFLNLVLSLFFLVLVGIIWDINFKGISIYIASAFTVIGAALFANWSILSNITASIILFFYAPFKIGTRIEIIDHDHPIVGTVLDITWFSIQILADDGNTISYPTNLAIQKPIKLLKK
jgi:MscS family membrane protein